MTLRRLVSIPALALIGLAFVVLLPVWLPLALLWDCCTTPRRMPRTRLALFGFWWSWWEIAGVVATGWLFVTGRARRPLPHYRLMRWWAEGLVEGLGRTCRLTIDAHNVDALVPGPVIVLPRHASLADALVSVWLVTQPGLRPRYVLKRELVADPCLDIVGHRLPNHFVDRGASDRAPELAAIRALAAGVVGADDAVVIFPEGTRANPDKRAAALTRLAERDPTRAARLAGLRQLNPPRPAGTLAVLDGAPNADVVMVAHAGFEGLDTFAGILRAIPATAPVLLDCVRIPRAHVPPRGDDVDPDSDRTSWLDDAWCCLDDRVEELVAARAELSRGARRTSR